MAKAALAAESYLGLYEGVEGKSTCFFALPFQCSPPAADFDCTRAHSQPRMCPTSP